MTKKEILERMNLLIEKKAKEYGLPKTKEEYGTAFENSFWEGVFTDDSEIPNIIYSKNGEYVELRSFWGDPEIDIRVNGRLLVITYTDHYFKDKEKFKYEDGYRVCQVRVDDEGNYKMSINEIYEMIDFIGGIENEY